MHTVATVPKERTFLFSREQDRNMAEIGKPHGIQRTIIIIAECAATGFIISGCCCCCLSLLSLVSWSWTSIRVPDCTPVVAHQVQLQHPRVSEAAANDLLLDRRRRRRWPGGGIASGARHVNKCFREFDADLHCESRYQRYTLGDARLYPERNNGSATVDQRLCSARDVVARKNCLLRLRLRL